MAPPWKTPAPSASSPGSCGDVEALLPGSPEGEAPPNGGCMVSYQLVRPPARPALAKWGSAKGNQLRLACAALVVAVGACTWYSAGRRGSRSPTGAGSMSVASGLGGGQGLRMQVKVENATPAADCSGAGENCFHSKCCTAKGKQCYHKEHNWAACKPDCVEGPDPYDIDNISWSCKKLGNRTEGVSDEPLGQIADWVKEQCTAGGGNCYETKCCTDGGKQCFEKDDGWAACKTFCTPGPDLTDANNRPWTCKALGFRTPGTPSEPPPQIAGWVKTSCSKTGEDCRGTMCCRDEGMQCYNKTDKWAACKPDCAPGPDLQDKDYSFWNCSALGSRTPGKNPEPLDWVSPWVKSKCSGSGQNCSESRCCREPGMQCFQKDHKWAACKSTCLPGPDIFDVDNVWWSCKVHGPRTPGTAPAVSSPVAGWVKSECAGGGEDCSKSQCCRGAGMQCYQKAEGWAACRPSCTPGPDLFDANMDLWNCKTLGPRMPGEAVEPERKIAAWVKTQCSAPAKDCSQTQCCQGDGLQCYQKKEGWATCKASCTSQSADPNDVDKAPWSCNTLGPRTPGFAPCVADGEDCRFSHCCSKKGMQCYEKDAHWASCMDTCGYDQPDGKWSCKRLGNRTNFGTPLGCSWAGADCGLNKVCCQEGLQCISKDKTFAGCLPGKRDGWENTVLGGSRVKSGKGDDLTWGSNLVPPAAAGKEAGTSLYCFMAVLKDTVEEELMYAHKHQNAGIYGCDKNYVFPAHKSKFKHEGSWNSVANTAVFLGIWQAILEQDDWLKCDWTIKVDPDTVFFADRLKEHIAALKPPAYTPIYLKNTLMYNGFLGAIEIFSREAVKLYHDYGYGCAKDMAEKGGEDGFFKLCMDSIGVGYMLDDDILSSKAYPKFCNGTFVSYHPFKTVDSWMACRDVAAGTLVWGAAEDAKFGTD